MICWCVSVLQIHFFPIPLWRMSSAKCRLPFDQILSRCFWTFGADTKLFMNVSSLLPSRDVGPWTGIVPAATILVLIQFSSSSCHITTLWNICWIRSYLDEYGFQMVLLEAWTLHFFSQIHSIFSKTRVGGSKTVRSFSENSCKMESLGFPTKLYENLPSHKLTLCTTVWTWWVWRLGHSCVDGHSNIANRSKTEKNQNGKHGSIQLVLVVGRNPSCHKQMRGGSV